MGLRCIVLGGGGFIGRNLCLRLAQEGAEVTAYGRSRSPDDALDPRIRWLYGDLGDRVALAAAIDRQDVVFHLISGSVPESSNRDPAAELAQGPIATLYLLEICKASMIKKIIFASSGGTVYGKIDRSPVAENASTNPISAYGISKLIIEKYLFLYSYLHGLDYQILRIANPYGQFQTGSKGQGLVGTLIFRALKGLSIEIWGTGDVTRDFIHVDDVVEALLASVHYSGPEKVLNVGSGFGLSVRQIVSDIEAGLGYPIERLHKAARSADVPVSVLDISLIQAETDWRPLIPWPEGLKRTIAWMKSQQARNNPP